VRRILDAITGAAAFVRNDRLDVLAANTLGYALYSEMFAGPTRPSNAARFIFLDPRARDFYPDWNKAADDSVAVLRASAGRDPHDRCLSELVGELSTQSDDFRTGQRTTSASTSPASNTSTTRPSASSRSPTTDSTSSPIPD
jgi:hypothetical protein